MEKIVKCKDCKKKVSRWAYICPGCGRRLPGIPTSIIVLGYVVVFIIWIIIALNMIK